MKTNCTVFGLTVFIRDEKGPQDLMEMICFVGRNGICSSGELGEESVAFEGALFFTLDLIRCIMPRQLVWGEIGYDLGIFFAEHFRIIFGLNL